jgi:hypothetical protein
VSRAHAHTTCTCPYSPHTRAASKRPWAGEALRQLLRRAHTHTPRVLAATRERLNGPRQPSFAGRALAKVSPGCPHLLVLLPAQTHPNTPHGTRTNVENTHSQGARKTTPSHTKHPRTRATPKRSPNKTNPHQYSRHAHAIPHTTRAPRHPTLQRPAVVTHRPGFSADKPARISRSTAPSASACRLLTSVATAVDPVRRSKLGWPRSSSATTAAAPGKGSRRAGDRAGGWGRVGGGGGVHNGSDCRRGVFHG